MSKSFIISWEIHECGSFTTPIPDNWNEMEKDDKNEYIQGLVEEDMYQTISQIGDGDLDPVFEYEIYDSEKNEFVDD